MKFKYYKKIIACFLLAPFLFFFTAFSVQAVIVPCGGYATPDTGMCTLCHLIVGIKRIIDYAFLLFVGLALVMLVIAGIMYIVSAGSSGMMESAKGLMKNALIGFSIVLLAWLMVNYTMYLLSASPNLGISEATNWYTFTCNSTSSAGSGSGTTSGGGSSSSSSPGTSSAGGSLP